MSYEPTTPQEVQNIVKTNHALLTRGGGSKPALSTPIEDITCLDMRRLSGMLEYEPGEYTFTAYAGTPVQQVITELTKHGQYLPFDPLLVKRGATLGGIVAANTSGSGRYRFGGVRDFILGIHFVDGQGQLVRGGGKVVKNAAGFDLPKFMVGSLGRYGVFVDLTFKVFPVPQGYVTLRASYANLEAALQAIYQLATASLDVDALDLEPLPGGQYALLVRFGGLVEALPGRTERLQNFLHHHTSATAIDLIQGEAETQVWEQIQECGWVDAAASLVKVPLSPKRIPALEAALLPDTLARRYSAGGNVAWLAVSNLPALDAVLNQQDLAGLVLFGSPVQPIIGRRKGLPLAQRVKRALDPAGKFLDP